ncbi:hypothetical protein ACFFSH_39890 [Streptomyces filamentosus]|uniref:Uncharacterized protein n=1 Tax=Streptomyces filamentosus TaxID=67294 RepID=A0A919ESR8_STRFL|nr:hypothetical protein [Streptomyces filamentosus]GHG30918.1 hypothetical protein GCM10017667_80560 [Streptomyces filamentosus]GHG31961.1 hypothetical protein GCM10017667_82360 [Streptomyces filamentosus]
MSDTKSALRFAEDVAEHELEIVLDQGVHRHLRFKAPDHSFYWFEIVTWPGSLVIRGDVSDHAFSQQTTYMLSLAEDMLPYFRGNGLNPSYWAQKVRGGEGVTRFSSDAFRRQVVEELKTYGADSKLMAAVREELLEGFSFGGEEAAREALDSFSFGDFRFHDIFEWDLTEPTPQFLWCLRAILWGIARYDEVKAEIAAEAAS